MASKKTTTLAMMLVLAIPTASLPTQGAASVSATGNSSASKQNDSAPSSTTSSSSSKPLPFDSLAAQCAPDIHPKTLKGVVTTESAWNPYAIGVVGGKLARQPRELNEAIATAKELERQGFNFSLGLGQVNRYNLAKYGETYETIFEPCRNLKAGGAILKDCFERAKAKIPDEQAALRAAFSCYYSGNFSRGFKPDRPGEPSYVEKVVANSVTETAQAIPVVPSVKPQNGENVSTPTRKNNRSMSEPERPWVMTVDPSQYTGNPGNQTTPVQTGNESTQESANRPNNRNSRNPPPWVILVKPPQQPLPSTPPTPTKPE